MPDLHWHATEPLLQTTLKTVMATPLFDPFRLIGGTALALQIGHRTSVDIDLFTDSPYGSIDFDAIDTWLRQQYPYVTVPLPGPIGFGKFYFVGNSKQEAVKLDICYTDPFIHPPIVQDQIRMATVEEIIAMKIDVVQRRGRKKDFWDIHALLDNYTIEQMISLHAQRYPYDHDPARIRQHMTDFSEADGDFDPNCLRKNLWEFIKLDLIAANT